MVGGQQNLTGDLDHINVSVHTEKVSGRLLWYASFHTTGQMRQKLMPNFRLSLSVGLKGNHQKKDQTYVFWQAEHARTYLYILVILEMFPFLFHNWLGSQQFVIIWRPGDTCALSVLFVIFRYKNEVWIGHTDDKLNKRCLG